MTEYTNVQACKVRTGYTTRGNAVIYQANGYSAWAARITGTDAKFGVAREFVGKSDVTMSRSNKSRTWEWSLTDGIYEVMVEHAMYRKDRSYYRIEAGEMTEISHNEALVAAEAM